MILNKFSQITMVIIMALAGASAAAFERETSGFGYIQPRKMGVSFVSYGAGIDNETQDKVLEVVTRGLRQGWLTTLETKVTGFEGDIAYCLYIQNREIAGTVAAELKAIIEAGNRATSNRHTELKIDTCEF